MYFETEEALKANFTESLAPRLSKGLMKSGDTLRGFHNSGSRAVGFRITSEDRLFNITGSLNYTAFPWDDSVSGQAWVMEKFRFIIMEKVVYNAGSISHSWRTYIERESPGMSVYVLKQLKSVADYENEVVQIIREALVKKQTNLKKRFLDIQNFVNHPDANDKDIEYAEEDITALYREMRRLKGLTVK